MLENKYHEINKLVRKYKDGEKDVIFDLYEFYRPLLSASVKRCLSKEPSLNSYKEDIVEDSFFVFEKLLEQYDQSLSYFSYFLSTRIDINLFRYATDKYKSNTSYLEETNSSEIFHDPFNKIDDMISIQSALSQLNQKQRQAIELYFFDNLDQQEAASFLNITQSSFSKRLQRALAKLKDILGNDFWI